MKVNGIKVTTRDTEEDIKSGLMEVFSKDIGKMINQMAGGD